MKEIWRRIENQPYLSVMLIAIILRLIAAIFSQGYGMHDDHFLVIEASQSWVDGYDYNNWLPWNQVDPKPEGHSFFYVGLHYLILSLFKLLGIEIPYFKMLLIRIIHALFSLITVSLSYKITEILSDKKKAFKVGLLMASFWFMPFLSVRNLVEIFAMPFLMIGIYLILMADRATDKNSKAKVVKLILLAGLIMGIAFSVRYQTILFIGGTGLVLFIQQKWKEMFIFGIGALTSIIFFQSIVDFFIWGYPFAEFSEYVRYNIEHRNNYLTGPWYMYLGVLIGIFLIPLGFFILFGYFRTWRKHLLIFLPSFIFLAFHSYFPNKQERFIFTIIPFIVILGMIGWESWVEKTDLRKKISRYGMMIFWILNILLLCVVTISFSKKSRVKAMEYLADYKVSAIFVDYTGDGKFFFMPRFYSDQWPYEYLLEASDNLKPEMYKSNISKDELLRLYKNEVSKVQKQAYIRKDSKFHNRMYELRDIDFVFFATEENLEKRVALMKELIPDLKYRYTAEPGLLDKIVHKLNPINKNQAIFVYSVGEPEKR